MSGLLKASLRAALLVASASLLGGVALAQEVTLRVQHFLPPSAPAQVILMEPWAKRVMEQSGGRIKVEIYPAMQLGGKPPQLFDQVREGVADVVWTVAGYTPGRFPKLEVFELPFVPASAKVTSAAVEEFYQTYARDELESVHPILVHAHSPGAFHMRGHPIKTLEDLKGAKVRAPTRIINDTLAQLGATPVGMPVPAVPEALSKGVVDGAVLPYEVTLPLRIHELTDSHTEFAGDRGLYTAVFLYLMNKDKYESLPPDLKKVIDDNSGIELALATGAAWDKAEAPGRKAAQDAGDTFYTIEGDELARWKKASEPVIKAWVAERGPDGEKYLAAARELIAKYSAQ